MADKERKLPAEFDENIRTWMAAEGWTANATRDYVDEDVYVWRQDTSSGSSPPCGSLAESSKPTKRAS